jgi:DNA-binding winged helix-turn-helix (wHTH) protein/tetratricopeptide (TPR) repeat protein
MNALSPLKRSGTPESTTAVGDPPAAIQLINSPVLRLGALTIDPPRRRLVHDDGREAFLEPRVMQVLVAFARAPGAILSREDLIASCWEGRFVSDDAVNRVMSRLRRVSQEIGKDSLRLETITKVGFRLILAQSPDPAERPSGPPGLALVDLTPRAASIAPTQGVVEATGTRDSPGQIGATLAAAPPHTPPQPARATFGVAWPLRPGPIVAGIAGAALLALLAGLFIWRSTPKARVLPELQLASFENGGPTGAPGAAQALREELIAALGRGTSLQLLTDGAKASAEPLVFRLGGSVQPLGPTLRFTFTLSRGAPGAVIWSSVIERPVADATTAPKQVAAQVSFTVRCVLDGAAGYPGVLPQAAISNYAQFCAEVASSESGEAVSRRTEDLRKAVAAAPNFATGWAALGYVIGDTFAYPAALWDAGSRTEATEAADRALRLDPANTWGRLAKALLVPLPNYAGRDDGLRLAAQATDTFGDAHAAYARFLMSVGRLKEAAVIAERGYALDPNDREAITRLVQAFYMMNRVPEADALLAQARALWGDSDKLTIYKLWAATWDGHHQDALATLQAGRYDQAIRGVGPDTGAPAPIADGGAQVFGALESGRATDRARAAETMARLAADPRPIDPFVPVALAALGRDQDALAAEERTVKEWSTSLTFLLFTPPFANARRSPQFEALAERLGLISYWRMPGRAPDFCTDPNPPALCRGLPYTRSR